MAAGRASDRILTSRNLAEWLPRLGLGGGRSTTPRTVVLLGNSRVWLERSDTGAGTWQRGPFTWAAQMLRQRLRILNWAGVSGQTLQQLAARFGTDVAPHAPGLVYIADAVNDVTGGATFVQVRDRYLTLIALCRGIGARPVLATTAPGDAMTAGQRAVLGQVNTWVKALPDPDVIAVDVAAAVASTTGMTWAADTATDGLHQSRVGAARMGRVIADALDPLLPRTDPLPSAAGDPGNAVPNPFVAGTVGAGTPAGWNTYVENAALTVAARTDGGPGQWFQAVTAAGGFAYLATDRAPLAGVAAAGDPVEGLLELSSDPGWTVTGAVRLYCRLYDAGGNELATAIDADHLTGGVVGDPGDATPYPVGNQPGVGTPWVFRTPPLVVPPAATQANLMLEFGAVGAVRIGRAAVRKVPA